MKVLLTIGFAILITVNSFGQKIKYKDYKNDFSTKRYRDNITNEIYSPASAGIYNLLLPSVGYFYVREPSRGWCVLGCQLIVGGLALSGPFSEFGKSDSKTGHSSKRSETLMNSGLIAFALIRIWSIYDVVKIAKIKNLAYQKNKLTMQIKPDLLFVNQNNSSSIACGLKMNINF